MPPHCARRGDSVLCTAARSWFALAIHHDAPVANCERNPDRLVGYIWNPRKPQPNYRGSPHLTCRHKNPRRPRKEESAYCFPCREEKRRAFRKADQETARPCAPIPMPSVPSTSTHHAYAYASCFAMPLAFPMHGQPFSPAWLVGLQLAGRYKPVGCLHSALAAKAKAIARWTAASTCDASNMASLRG
ncbi:hypothetical protein ZWY2020_042942 [Hordeum vulgare]|nr:hypothetical protein ZWY2020_042942 [Hordeum vulgare]